MRVPFGSITRRAASAVVLLVSTAVVPSMAQKPPQSTHHQDTAKVKHGMPAEGRMGAMKGGPHQVLAMAHRDNVATFARALRGHLAGSSIVDLELARPAAAEMRRSYDQMKAHHQGMTMMSDSTKRAMPDAAKHMSSHLAALGEHLTALESALSTATPNHAIVSEHTAMIVKECAGMSSTPAKGKAHDKQ